MSTVNLEINAIAKDLFKAIDKNEKTIVETIFNHANRNGLTQCLLAYKSQNGDTALHRAVLSGNKAIVNPIIWSVSNKNELTKIMNARNRFFVSPIQIADLQTKSPIKKALNTALWLFDKL
jgi:ankyrin repeat protein